MKSPQVKARVRDSIQLRVAKVLQELGNPQPPLRLEDVRYLLELNLGYFQHDDAGVLQRLAHRLKVVGHQLANRPGLLVDAVKTLDLRALWVPDQKYVMIDKTQPKPKWRWLEAHEMGHKLCDWHGDFLFGDTEFSLSPACHQKLESEANYAAGQLLFLGDRFKVEATDLALGFSSIQRLKSVYQNTMTTTMWRYVEQLGNEKPLIGLITCHPHPSKRPPSADPFAPCKHFIQSPAFAERFSNLTDMDVFNLVCRYCGPQRGGPLGEAILELQDDNGDLHQFKFETFFNSHHALTLGWHLRLKPTLVAF
jgi:Zn-dependent peptidase ImmA (M78 family)